MASWPYCIGTSEKLISSRASKKGEALVFGLRAQKSNLIFDVIRDVVLKWVSPFDLWSAEESY